MESLNTTSLPSLPFIEISLASPEEPQREPFSPFASEHTITPVEDGYRPALLSPPPVISPRFQRKQSPLCPDTGKGLDSDHFQFLLASTRKRNSALAGKKEPDLRREIAVKTHKSKQVERRALFLSKVLAPPSPSATDIPKTPPESPAIFHYSLPSPGLESPLSLYDTLGYPDSPDGLSWVEQVDYRTAKLNSPSKGAFAQPQRKSNLPSLDEISARINSRAHGPVPQFKQTRSRAPLPSFLRSVSPPHEQEPPTKFVQPPTPRPKANVQPPTPRPACFAPVIRVQGPEAFVAPLPSPKPAVELMPAPKRRPRPRLDEAQLEVELQVTTTVVPRSPPTVSPSKLTTGNLSSLNFRTRSGFDMMSALRRRVSSQVSADGRRDVSNVQELDERKARRISAPAELQARQRLGFSHPVLCLPGGF